MTTTRRRGLVLAQAGRPNPYKPSIIYDPCEFPELSGPWEVRAYDATTENFRTRRLDNHTDALNVAELWAAENDTAETAARERYGK